MLNSIEKVVKKELVGVLVRVKKEAIKAYIQDVVDIKVGITKDFNSSNMHFLVKVDQHKYKTEVGKEYWIEAKYLDVI